jgi:hypothetical protein
MKTILCLLLSGLLFSCNSTSDNIAQLQSKVDSLENQLANSYKPGLGEFMTSIQAHHAKLWYAGINTNWELADFEMHEIEELKEDITKFCADRSEIKSIGMIDPAIETVKHSIKEKDLNLFKSSYQLLTNSCNNCHRSTEHGFNVVTIPSALPIVNQDFNAAQ